MSWVTGHTVTTPPDCPRFLSLGTVVSASVVTCLSARRTGARGEAERMPQLQVPLVTFTVEDGVVTSDSPFVATAGCQRIGRPKVHSFFAILEPLVAHPEISELAPLILSRLEQELATRTKLTATAAISASVEAVNEELHHYNRPRPAEERLYYGLTCGISRGEELYLAQVRPSQILISQDGDLYAFPGLESWHWSRRSDTNVALEQPLGMHGEIEPDLYHTRLEPGDLIVLCSGSLARVVHREPQGVFLQGDAAGAIEHLRELTEAYNVDNASSAAIAVTIPPESSRKRRDLDVLRRMSGLVASFLPEQTARHSGRHDAAPRTGVALSSHSGQTGNSQATEVDGEVFRTGTIPPVVSGEVEPDTRHVRRSGTDLNNPSFVDNTDYWDPHDHETLADDDVGSHLEYDSYVSSRDQRHNREGKRTLTEILAGAILALSAAVVGVWQLAVNRDRPVDSPREDESTFGLPRLQRYDNSIQGPDFSGVRRRLPRAPINRYTGFVSIGLVFALAIGLIYSVTTSRERERTEEFEALLGQSVAARQNAMQANDPTVAQSFLQASESRLQQAAALGVDEERLMAEQAAIADTRDASLGIERLGNVQVLGGVPPAPDGVNPNLFFGNGQLYIFTDALYQLDPEQSRLVRLIGEGDDVGGYTVGELQGAAWGHGTPMVMDGLNVYFYEPTSASWDRHELGNFGDSYSGVQAISGYIGNLYILSPETGQIIRYNSEQFDALPEDWSGGSGAEELSLGVDMMIDGRIYVMTEDGQILDFYRGALDDTATVNATPEVDGAVSMSFQSDRSYVYIADSHDRILRVTTDGEVVQQFMTEHDGPQMTNVQSLVVDDSQGSAYVLTDSALMQVRLPGPPR